MALIGIDLNRENPEYTLNDFLFWMPQFKNYCVTIEGQTMFDNLYPIANAKIFESIFGTDWKMAMSLCIAHYAYLIAQYEQAPSGDTLGQTFGGGVLRGVISSASVGGFSKSYDLQYTALNSEEALFWNQSAYGAQLMALYKTKAVPSIFVVTSGPIVPNGNPSFNPTSRYEDLLVPPFMKGR